MIRKCLLTALLVSGFAASAQAGVYVNAGAGIGGMDTKDFSNGTSGYNSMALRQGAAYRFALGHLTHADKFSYGQEFGYTAYPQNIYRSNAIFGTTDTYTGHYFDALSVGKYTFDSGGYLLAKGGLALVTQKLARVTNGVSSSSKSSRKVKPELAIGVGYEVSEHVGVDANFSHVFGAQSNPNGSNSQATRFAAINTVMAGINYNF